MYTAQIRDLAVPRYQLAHMLRQAAVVTGLVDLAATVLCVMATLVGLLETNTPMYACLVVLVMAGAAWFVSGLVRQSGAYIIASSALPDDDKRQLLRELS